MDEQVPARRRLLVGESGTSMTEFVVTLPVFLVLMSGILKLHAVGEESVRTEVRGYKSATKRVLEAQEEGLKGSVMGSGSTKHLTPASGAVDAAGQVEQFDPRQEGELEQAIRVVEHRTYSMSDGLALSGHWGESAARLRMLDRVGVSMLGVDRAVTDQPDPLLGDTVLPKQLVYDGPRSYFDGENRASGSPGNALQWVVDRANQLGSTSGARGALAANMRYGTVTGHAEGTASVAGRDFDFGSYYTLTVAPHARGDPWTDEALATMVSRLTLASSATRVYRPLLEYPYPGSRGSGVDTTTGFLDPPTPKEAGLGNPLTYDSETISEISRPMEGP